MSEHCKSCHEAADVLSEEAINAALVDLDGWSYDKAQNVIVKSFTFKGFAKTMGLVNAVAWIAQVEKHHPDVCFGYNYVKVTYQTHEAGGITDNDIICAKKVDALLD